MNITELTVADIPAILPFYIDHYNSREDGRWTVRTAGKRIHQVLSMEDSYGLLLREHGVPIGFAIGYFKQYDDIVGYTLEEIVIASAYQNQGYGSALLRERELRVGKRGASCVELQAVADAQHEHYYGKAGYRDAKNFVLKVKWLE